MDIQFCWEDDTTGCICGNECEPTQWVRDTWKAQDKIDQITRRRYYDSP